MKKSFTSSEGYVIVLDWLNSRSKTPFSFQKEAWQAYSDGYSGMVVAPTGFGKTFSVFLAVLIDYMNHPEKFQRGLQLLWVTPLRSLAKDLAKAMQEAVDDIGLDWTVEVRNGDTSPNVKIRQSKQMPEILMVTPESLHLLLAQKSEKQFFHDLKCIVVDEWHELLGTKRGVMVELALAYLRAQKSDIRIWGISATIGNLSEALEVLLPNIAKRKEVKAREEKKIEILPVYPDEVELLPWAGHLGGHLADKIIPIIEKSRSTILFTNTRSQSEIWYQLLLEANPELAGQMALHHSSIDVELRNWIEDSLSTGLLKVVVATSSLDLGLDFKPVDTVIQIGSGKGVARFIQRAGRSGHSPHEVSKIYFVPTHSIELIEAAALKEAVSAHTIEERPPLILTFDVLVQFLVTIALGGGFDAEEMFSVICQTFAFQSLKEEEWRWCLQFITVGGKIGAQYEEFHKVVRNEEGKYIVQSRRIAMLHRMNMGVIVSDAMIRVKYVSGGYIGMVEEYFIAKLKPGDKFILAGKILELVRVKDLEAQVKASRGKAITPSWLGGRLPLSSNLSHFLRQKLASAANARVKDEELKFLQPLLMYQTERSHIPKEDELLVEHICTREGHHLFVYPLEGRLVHEVMASLLAYRMSRLYPISFSMAMNDYGFELFTDSEIVLDDSQLRKLFTKDNLLNDVQACINAAEMARHKFRDIAVISGLVIQKMYGKQKNNKSIHASASLIFKVLESYDPDNLLLKQAYNEVFFQQLEEPRLMAAFQRIERSEIIYTQSKFFTPLSFPIKIDSLRQSLSSEDLLTRIEKIKAREFQSSKKKK